MLLRFGAVCYEGVGEGLAGGSGVGVWGWIGGFWVGDVSWGGRVREGVRTWGRAFAKEVDEGVAVVFCSAENTCWIHGGLVGRSFVAGTAISLCSGCKGRGVAL